ncbi:hypothetical protein BaRGS_00019694 [Batillaria attramentaria]|uniref:Nardilysin n=1 Tax=Batillaria attramentaria TaxID=370345 RepID=A0ABD0KPN3_9CAEN
MWLAGCHRGNGLVKIAARRSIQQWKLWQTPSGCQGPGRSMSHIFKSPLDTKEYREITLRNGLTALLISDIEHSRSDHLATHFKHTSHTSSFSESETGSDSGTDSSEKAMSVTDGDTATRLELMSDGESVARETELEIEGLEAVPAKEPKGKDKKKKRYWQLGLSPRASRVCDAEDVPMVFMGSRKYKKENAFDDFIGKHGGETNAWTDCERTTFFFDIQKQFFHKALDMFACFFISPLFLKNSVDREINAVDNEFRMIVPNDTERAHQLIGTLAVDGNPMSRFMCGSAKTLKTIPEEQRIDVYGRLRDFYKRMYSAHYMTLVVQAPEPLDDLQDLVYDVFEDIPNNNMLPPSFPQHRDPFLPRNFHKLFKVVPVEDTHKVDIVWALPPLYKHFKVKPLEYLSVLIAHEGRGSILAYLRKKAWALSLVGGNIGNGFDMNSLWSGFFVSIVLTDAGLKHVSDVIRTVYEYIALLQRCGPQAWFFNELRDIENIKFRFREEARRMYIAVSCDKLPSVAERWYEVEDVRWYEVEDVRWYEVEDVRWYEVEDVRWYEVEDVRWYEVEDVRWYEVEDVRWYEVEDVFLSLLDPIDNVEQVVENMQLYPLEHYLTGRTLVLNYDAQLLRECLSYLCPSQSCIMMWSKNYGMTGECDMVEPWFGTLYTRTASEFELHTVADVTEYPVTVMENQYGRMWYKKDTKFHTPKAYIYLHLMIPAVSESTTQATLSDLFMNVVQQILIESLYAATLTGYEYSLEGLSTGIVIHVDGFSHKLPDVLEMVVNHVADFTVTQELFDVVKAQLKKCYYNEMIKTYDFAKMLRFAVTEPNNPTLPERYRVVSSLTLDMLREFHERLTDSLYIEGLVMGNMTPQDAVKLAEFVQSKLCKKPLPPDKVPLKRLLQLPQGDLQCRVRGVNRQDTNSCVTSYYQGGPGTIRDSCLNDLLAMRMKEPVFNRLRTTLQLGYSVFCQALTSNGILGFAVSVETQANKFSMTDIECHITKFLQNFQKTMNRMSRSQYRQLVDAVITSKQVEDTQLGDEIATLKTITQSDLKSWYQKYLSATHRHVSFQVQGTHEVPMDTRSGTHMNSRPPTGAGSNVDQEEDFLQLLYEGPEFIRDVKQFRQSLTVFPYSAIVS